VPCASYAVAALDILLAVELVVTRKVPPSLLPVTFKRSARLCSIKIRRQHVGDLSVTGIVRREWQALVLIPGSIYRSSGNTWGAGAGLRRV
jgi:hypothetical protein